MRKFKSRLMSDMLADDDDMCKIIAYSEERGSLLLEEEL